MKYFILSLVTFCATFISSYAQTNADAIVGKWMSSENNLEVEVFKEGNEYKAKVVWFDASDNKTISMNERCDKRNPNKSLRSRKIIGMEVLHGLMYNAENEEWLDGRIYDASSGKDWYAKTWITKDGCLKIRGFWHFEFLGENIFFKKA